MSDIPPNNKAEHDVPAASIATKQPTKGTKAKKIDEPKDDLPNKSNRELWNEIKQLKSNNAILTQQVAHDEGIIADMYDTLDSIQNRCGAKKEKAKGMINQSPLKKAGMQIMQTAPPQQ